MYYCVELWIGYKLFLEYNFFPPFSQCPSKKYNNKRYFFLLSANFRLTLLLLFLFGCFLSRNLLLRLKCVSAGVHREKKHHRSE